MMRQHGDGKDAETIRCGTCSFYDMYDTRCHRYPPNAVVSRTYPISQPLVESNDWCGEYEDFADD